MSNIGDTLRFDLMTHHCGMQNAIHSRELQRRYSVSARDIRHIVSDLRMAGVPICSGQAGYWYAESKTEVFGTIMTLQAEANSLRKVVSGLYDYYYGRVAK